MENVQKPNWETSLLKLESMSGDQTVGNGLKEMEFNLLKKERLKKIYISTLLSLRVI